MHSRVPHPALRSHVAAMVGYREHVDPRSVHHGLPGPTLTVVLAFDEPLDSAWLHDPAGRASYWTLAAGLHTAPALIRTHGHQHGIQLALTPLGARTLLGVPAGALGAAMTDHTELPGGVPDGLHAALAALPDWSARFDLLERHLLGRLAAAAPDTAYRTPAEVTEAWRLTCGSGGRMRVADVADHVGWSRRRLLERFRAEYGVAPKEAARIVRFDRAHRAVDAGRPLADVAAEAGYADQAHLAREYAALAGRTASELRASAYHVPAPR